MFRNALLCAAALTGLAFVTMTAASAGGYRVHKAEREYARRAPLKDCTRINGRYGYYGNPWCTPAEQRRWDNYSYNASRNRWR